MSKTLPWWTLSKTLPWWTHCRSLCTALTLQDAQALEGNKTFTYNVILPGHHSVTSRLYIHIHTAVISPDKQDRLWRKLLCVKFENCYKRKDRHPGKTFVHQDGFKNVFWVLHLFRNVQYVEEKYKYHFRLTSWHVPSLHNLKYSHLFICISYIFHSSPNLVWYYDIRLGFTLLDGFRTVMRRL